MYGNASFLRVFGLAALLGAGGCFGSVPPAGAIYGDVSVGNLVTTNNIGKKKGEACASSILGLVTTGDAGIRAAADAGGVTQISAVDTSQMNVLFFYYKYCTIVSGDAGDATTP